MQRDAAAELCTAARQRLAAMQASGVGYLTGGGRGDRGGTRRRIGVGTASWPTVRCVVASMTDPFLYGTVSPWHVSAVPERQLPCAHTK